MAKKATSAKQPRARPLFSLSLDPAERAALDKAAAKEDRPSAYVARRAIVDWLGAELINSSAVTIRS